MRCVVPGCKNDSRNNFKSEGITFHSFPIEQAIRSAWLKALDRPHFQIKERSTICSEHFLIEDMYETQCGLRKVRSGAVPFITQNIRGSCDLDKPITTKICRMCLANTNRLFSIKRYQLEPAFERLTGLTINNDDRLPRKLCALCATRLRNCDRIRENALRAHTLMVDLLKTSLQITSKTLESVSSDFQFLKVHIPSSDIHFEHTDQKTEVDIKTIDNEQEMDIKKEDESIFVDDLSPKNELSVDYDSGSMLIPLSDKGFDTDDSLPLEAQRKKRKKVKKEPVKKIKIPKPTEPKIDRRRKPFLNQDLNETLFTVTDLTVEEQLAEVLKRQDTDNYKHSVFKCTECFKGFLDQDAYSSHMVRHTSECGDHRCEICKTHFKHSHALRKHITAHHLQRFSCNHCPYVTTHRQTARLHERWHKGTKYQCPHCNLEFVKFTTYMGHVRIKHPSDFVCELCGYSFVSAKGIELHKKLKHRGDETVIPENGPHCELCNVRFVSTDAHRKHMSVSARHAGSDRENNKPTRGRKCREQIDREKLNNETEDDEKRRMYPSQMRKSEGPISCEQCGMELEDSRAYHGHFRRMHPDKNRTNYPSMKSPCMCEVCGRIFQSYALLKDHTWVHTGERPFKCDQCGKSFRMKQRLVAHRRVHSDVKASYVCSVCGKHFSTHSNRQRHMFIHTGLKPFKCEMCGKGFKHASEKRAHVSYVHLKKPWPKRARAKRPIRQGSLPPQAGASEMDIQPVWPAIDPKLTDINMIDDKPMYYR